MSFIRQIILAMLCALLMAAGARAEGTGTGGGVVLGMNLSQVNDWSREWVFVDVFKHSRPWISQYAGGKGAWENPTPLEVDAQGWPVLKQGQAAGTLMLRSMGGHYPAGTYVCTYEGSGVIDFGLDAKVIRRGDHRLEVGVRRGEGGIYLRIDQSNPANPVRNIHVWMPGMEGQKSPFHPTFAERLRPFKVIRFMDWELTNGNPLTHWSERTTPTSVRQSGPNGVAVEYMVELCNELGADPWFCMPHLADEGFVREFATLVRDRLHPGGKIYVEFSNETWNSQFGQSRWAREEGKKRGVDFTTVVAERARVDGKIWKEVFGKDADRVVRVAAGQHHGVGVTTRLLEAMAGDFDAVSCAAYFFVGDDAKTFGGGTTPDQVIDSAMKNWRTEGIARLKDHQALARKWSEKLGRHVPLICYEGGQHLAVASGGASYGGAIVAALRSQKSYDAYRDWLADVSGTGVEMMCAYLYASAQGKSGSFGHLEYQDQPISEAPMYRALVEHVGARANNVPERPHD